MTDTEKNVEINLASDLEVVSTLLEQLKSTFSELKSHNVVASNDIEWNDIECYFRNLEATAKKKLEDLEVKEKEFTEKESHNNILLAEREAAIVAKEQEIVDKIQDLKDAAVAEIAEARTVYVPEKSDGLTNGNKVDFNARELEAINAVISCVEEYKLEAEYPLHQLYIRASQLDKSIKVPRKRAGDDSSTSKQPQAPHPHKRQGPDRRFQAPRGRGGRGFGGGRSGRRQGRGPPAYSGHPQRYPPPATPTAYTYPVATQSYANDPYYYGQDQQGRASYAAVPPSYGSYQPPSYPPHQPYM